MLTYTPLIYNPAPVIQRINPWFVCLLCLFWLIPGLFGHDPWKPFEPETIDIIWNFLQGQSLLLPTLIDTVYLERNPLFYWIAAGVAKIIPGNWLLLHDIVRCVAGFFAVLTIGGISLAATVLYGRGTWAYAIFVLLGSIGFLFWGHHAGPQMLSMAGFAWLIYALAWAQSRPLLAGVILGCAILTIFLGGTPQELLLAFFLIMVALVCSRLRVIHMMVLLGTALIIAIPFGLLWPLALKEASPQIYTYWLSVMRSAYALSGPGFIDAVIYYFTLLPWFAWPALPLSIWSIWSHKKELREKKWLLPMSFLVVMLLWLSLFVPHLDDAAALPMLLPLSLLAAGGINTQRRGLASALNWFSIVTFGLSALMLWLIWLTIQFGLSLSLAKHLTKFGTLSVITNHPVAIGFAVFLTLSWLCILFNRWPVQQRAIINWVSGLTLFWGLAMSLLLPWLDAGKTYRHVAQELRMVMPNHHHCVASVGTTISISASLHYFSGLTLEKVEEGRGRNCDVLLLIAGNEPVNIESDLLWTGERQGEKNERFYLYFKPQG